MPFFHITEHIRVWLDRRRLRRYGLRLATEGDLDFIMTEVVHGALNGHFASSLLDPKEEGEFREQLRNVIRFSAMTRMTKRGGEEIVATLWIYGSQKDDQVGYLLTSERLPGSLESEIELYLAGVREGRRGLGHGRRITQLFVAFTLPTISLYARCYLPSQTMFLLLQEVGFSHSDTTPSGIRELALCRA